MLDKERDREMNKQMFAGQRDWVDRQEWNHREYCEREAAWKRDMELLRLLDRERVRDRQSANHVTGLLEGELDRSRIVNPDMDPPEPVQINLPEPMPARRKRAKKLKASKRADDKKDEDSGLKSEVEALRKDLKKLLNSSSKANSVVGEDKVQRSDSVGSDSTASSRRSLKKAPRAPEIHFEPARPRVIEIEEDDEDEDDDSA